MKNRKPDSIDQAELVASLEPLGIREINERLEVSPLLADRGAGMIEGQDTVCCVCKISPEVLETFADRGAAPSISQGDNWTGDNDGLWYMPR
jgi:hypothetical protein